MGFTVVAAPGLIDVTGATACRRAGLSVGSA